MRYARLLPLFVCVMAVQSLSAQVPRRPFLFKDARGELAAARARGEADVLLVVASMPGANEHVVATIEAYGGTIQFRSDDVDYLRARVPVDNVEALVRDEDVHSVDVSIHNRSKAFGLASGAEATSDPFLPAPLLPLEADTTKPKWPPKLSEHPLTDPYIPLADIGAAQFRETHPTFDGRGVTLALIDGNPDPLLPELQVATALDGQPVPKIVVYETAIDAVEEPDGRWLDMIDTVAAVSGSFEYDSTTYTAPRAGTYLIAIFDEAMTDSLARTGMEKDINRDGNPEESSRLFAVLWDPESNDVWVDTDQDLDFTNEKALTDYAVRAEFAVWGTDDPETPVRESVGFAVQTDPENGRVSLNLGVASHASLVIGAALANRGTDGRFDGVAPGARLASISEGGSAYGQTEAVIVAAQNEHVDIIFLEQSSRITRAYLLRDGRLVPTVIYSRLIERYRKPIVVPTHNYPILGGIDDFVLARGAIGIGGHESKDNFFTNHGVRVEHDDNLLITGGYGPMGDGALKPDVIAPSNHLSTGRGFVEGRAVPGLFQLPPGYTIAGGTSTATPTAAAAVALLISGARQAGIGHDAFRIKHALVSSARYVDHLPAYKQGNGVVNVAGAWEMLQALDTASVHVDIASRAPVRHVFSDMLPTPNTGVGLYERDGWEVGESGVRTVTFTRTSGPREPMTFAMSWTGNDGTFSADEEISLPLGEPVETTIEISPAEHGVHTALLTLDHPDVPGFAYRMLAAIVASERLNAENEFTVETETEIPRPGMRSFFYDVPEGVSALRIDLDKPKRAVALAVIRPDTRQETGTRGLPNETGKLTFVVNNPMAGTWEVRLSDITDTRTFDWEQAKKPEPVPPTAATLTVSALATSVSLTGSDVGAAHAGLVPGGMTQGITVTNSRAAFTGRAAGFPAGSAHRAYPTITPNEQQIFDVEVPPGSPALVVRAQHPAESDIDVYLFNCTDEDKGCEAARADADRVGEESIMIEKPDAGLWKVVVDAVSVPSGGIAYDYVDVVFNPKYGTVSVADVPEERESKAEWRAQAHTWITGAAAEEGRSPYAAVLVEGKDEDGNPFIVTLRELHAGETAETGSNPQ